jgi:hypothetical protein
VQGHLGNYEDVFEGCESEQILEVLRYVNGVNELKFYGRQFRKELDIRERRDSKPDKEKTELREKCNKK